MAQKSAAILSILLFGVIPAAMANITPTRISGGKDPVVDSWSRISMESEVVSLEAGPVLFSVDGRYWLRNPDTRPTSEEIGYPYDHRFPNELRNFSAWVNDKPVEVGDGEPDPDLTKALKDRFEIKPKKTKYPLSSGGSSPLPNMEVWKIWKVQLPARANCAVRVKYSTLPRPSSDQFSSFGNPLGQDEMNFTADEYEAIALANGDELESKYILWTGGRWNGKIKQGVILAKIKKTPDWQVSLNPKPKSFDGQNAKWVFRNFKPAEWGSDGAIVIKFQPRKLSVDQRADMYKNVAFAHPRRFAFCAEAANKLDELKGVEAANQIRVKSIQAWTPADEVVLVGTNVGFGYFPDPVLEMSWQAFKYFDAKSDSESASLCARMFCTVFQKGLEAEDPNRYPDEWSKTQTQKGIRLLHLLLKYGVDLEVNPKTGANHTEKN